MGNFKSLDIFGQNFAFNVNKEEKKYKTNTGALVSIICIVMTSLGAYIFTTDYSDTTSPRVTLSSEFLNSYPKIDAHASNFVPVVAAFNRTGLLQSSEFHKFTTPIASKIEFKSNPETGAPELAVVASQKMINCKDADLDEDDIEETVEKSGASDLYHKGYLLCPENMGDNNFWTIQGSADYMPYSYISLDFFPCSLPDPSQCAKMEEVVQYQLDLTMSYNTYKLDQKENPIQRLFAFEKLISAFNPASTNVGHMTFKTIRIMDEDKDFVKPKLNTQFYSFGEIKAHSTYRPGNLYCDAASILKEICPPYITIQIKSGHEVETVLRVYPKLFSMISELGGFGDLIFILIGFLYFSFNSFYFNRYYERRISNKEIDKALLRIRKGDLTKENLKQGKRDYQKKKLSSFNIMKNTAKAEGISLVMLDPAYRKVLETIPLLEHLKQPEEEEISFEAAMKAVIKSHPENDLQKRIKKRLEFLMDDSNSKKCSNVEEVKKEKKNKVRGKPKGKMKEEDDHKIEVIDLNLDDDEVDETLRNDEKVESERMLKSIRKSKFNMRRNLIKRKVY